MLSKLLLYMALTGIYLFLPISNYGPELRIYALDVGQGDSYLIETPSGHRILIDGGPSIKVVEELDAIIPIWDRHIDMLMLSHSDLDHVAGVGQVLRRYEVGHVFKPAVKGDSSSYKAFEQLSKKYPGSNFGYGSSIALEDGVHIVGLWPKVSKFSLAQDANALSQVSLLQYGEFSALFTGDIDTQAAQVIQKVIAWPDIEMLKVPHHGSRFGLAERQLLEMSPLISIISVGSDNRYGHPAPSTIDLLDAVGSRIYRTDDNGRVLVFVDEAGFGVRLEQT